MDNSTQPEQNADTQIFQIENLTYHSEKATLILENSSTVQLKPLQAGLLNFFLKNQIIAFS